MFFNQRSNTIIIKVLIKKKKGKQELRPTLKCWFPNFLHTWPVYSLKRQLWLIIKVYYTGCFKKNTPKLLRDMSKTKNNKKLKLR